MRVIRPGRQPDLWYMVDSSTNWSKRITNPGAKIKDFEVSNRSAKVTPRANYAKDLAYPYSTEDAIDLLGKVPACWIVFDHHGLQHVGAEGLWAWFNKEFNKEIESRLTCAITTSDLKALAVSSNMLYRTVILKKSWLKVIALSFRAVIHSPEKMGLDGNAQQGRCVSGVRYYIGTKP